MSISQEPSRSPSSCRICGGSLDADIGFCQHCASSDAGIGEAPVSPRKDGADTRSTALVECPKCKKKVAPRELNGLCPNCLFDALEDDDGGLDRCEAPEVPGYRMLRLIGRGGMGVVWLAEQQGTKQKVAVKLCLSHGAGLSGGARDGPLLRFAREIELTASIHHPGIARVFDGGESEGVPYVVMEYVDGVDVAKYVCSHQLDRRQIVELLRRVCEAVQHAHQNGVIHRDLKPSNILVTTEGQPKVLDFGLAKALGDDGGGSQDLTVTGQLIGTPRYMAPEQIAGGVVDTRTDVYALGVILYELLTGAHPHGGTGSRGAMLHRIETEEPKRPKDSRQDLDSELEMLLLKALQKEPEDRYRSAGDMEDDLGRWLDNEPLVAGKATLAYFVRKWLFRHRRAATVVIGVTAIVLLSAVLMRSAKSTIEEYNAREANRLHRDGRVAENSGNHKEAIEALEQTVKLRKKRNGPGHPDTLEAENDLAVALQKEGKSREALPLFQEVLTRRRRQHNLDPDHPHVLLSMNNLAGCYLDADESEKALELSETTFQQSKQVLGLDHPDTLKIMSNLARAWRVSGIRNGALPKEALQRYEEAFNLSKLKLGPDHPDTLTCMNNLAVAHEQAGEFHEAIVLYKEALDRSRKEGDPGSLTIETNLAGVCFRAGEFQEAIPLYEHALKKGRENQDADNPDTLTTMFCLAIAYEADDQLKRALPLYAEATKRSEGKFGPDNPETLKRMSYLAAAYSKVGELQKALQLFEQMWKTRTAKLGSDDPATLRSLRNVALTYRDLDDLQISTRLLEDHLAAQRKRLRENDPDLIQFEREFADVQTQARAAPPTIDAARVSQPAPAEAGGHKQSE